MPNFSPKNAELYRHVRAAVVEGLEHVRERLAKGGYLSRYFRFPILTWHESGLPRISEGSSILGDTPIDYKAFFNEEGSRPEQIASWQSLLGLVEALPELRKNFGFEETLPSNPLTQRPHELAKSGVRWSLEHIIDHYVHLFQTTVFEEHLFDQLYRAWEHSIYLEQLPFDILVPIIYVNFDSDSLVYPGFNIERLSPELQLARSEEKTPTVSAHADVAAAATHAVVLENWLVDNPGFWRRSHMMNAKSFAEPLKRIDNFFAALRVVTGLDTGYSQVVVRPRDWGDNWSAYLPHILGFSIRQYPDHFEQYGWTRRPPIVDRSACDKIAAVFNELQNNRASKLSLAARRLNAAALRRDDEDAILDVTIGLEMLLTDDSRNEVTFRLAMRLAGLTNVRRFEEHKPSQVLTTVKRLYDFRSAVVHGSTKTDAKRLIQVTPENSVPAVALGIRLLRHVLLVLCDRTEFLDVSAIDRAMVEGELRIPDREDSAP